MLGPRPAGSRCRVVRCKPKETQSLDFNLWQDKGQGTEGTLQMFSSVSNATTKIFRQNIPVFYFGITCIFEMLNDNSCDYLSPFGRCEDPADLWCDFSGGGGGGGGGLREGVLE